EVRALERGDRTPPLHPVVRPDEAPRDARGRRGPSRRDPDPSVPLGADVLPMDGRDPGLVHLAPGALGPCGPRRSLPGLPPGDPHGRSTDRVRPVRRLRPKARPGCARHLVHVVALAGPLSRLARTGPRARPLLPGERPRRAPRHLVLLWRPDDDARLLLPQRPAVLGRLLHRDDPGRAGPPDVEASRQLPGAARPDPGARRRRAPLRARLSEPDRRGRVVRLRRPRRKPKLPHQGLESGPVQPIVRSARRAASRGSPGGFLLQRAREPLDPLALPTCGGGGRPSDRGVPLHSGCGRALRLPLARPRRPVRGDREGGAPGPTGRACPAGSLRHSALRRGTIAPTAASDRPPRDGRALARPTASRHPPRDGFLALRRRSSLRPGGRARDGAPSRDGPAPAEPPGRGEGPRHRDPEGVGSPERLRGGPCPRGGAGNRGTSRPGELPSDPRRTGRGPGRDGSPGRGVRRVLLGAAGRLGSDGRGPPQGAGEALRAPRENPGTSCRPGVPGSGASGGGPRGRSEGGGARGTGAAHRRTLEAGRRVHRGTMTPTSRTARPTKSKKRVAGPPKAAPPAVKIEAIELVSGGRPHPALGVGLWALGRWTTEDEARTKATI